MKQLLFLIVIFKYGSNYKSGEQFIFEAFTSRYFYYSLKRKFHCRFHTMDF